MKRRPYTETELTVEQNRYEQLLGVSEETLEAMRRSPCADCNTPNLHTEMWYTPTGPICRGCRDARLARTNGGPSDPRRI